MKASVDWMSRKDTLTGSHESAAFSPRTLEKMQQGPPGAVPYLSDAAHLEPGLREEVRKLVPRDLLLYRQNKIPHLSNNRNKYKCWLLRIFSEKTRNRKLLMRFAGRDVD